MAMVPQIVILSMALFMLEPPVFAEVAPSMTRNMIVKPYNQYSNPLIGAKKTIDNGKTPPTENDAPDATAA